MMTNHEWAENYRVHNWQQLLNQGFTWRQRRAAFCPSWTLVTCHNILDRCEPRPAECILISLKLGVQPANRCLTLWGTLIPSPSNLRARKCECQIEYIDTRCAWVFANMSLFVQMCAIVCVCAFISQSICIHVITDSARIPTWPSHIIGRASSYHRCPIGKNFPPNGHHQVTQQNRASSSQMVPLN